MKEKLRLLGCFGNPAIHEICSANLRLAGSQA